jgi:hypothetical protein
MVLRDVMLSDTERWAYVVSAVTGAATWFVIAGAGGREAWDSDLYFSVGLPAIGIVAAALGFLVPHRAWRWAFVPFGAQALAAFAQNPTANLLPIGLMVFGVLGVGCLVPTYVGVAIARIVRRA